MTTISKPSKSKELYIKLCLIGLSAGIVVGGIVGLTAAAASPFVASYYIVKAVANRLTTT